MITLSKLRGKIVMVASKNHVYRGEVIYADTSMIQFGEVEISKITDTESAIATTLGPSLTAKPKVIWQKYKETIVMSDNIESCIIIGDSLKKDEVEVKI